MIESTKHPNLRDEASTDALPVSPALQWSRVAEHSARQWAEVFYYGAFALPRLWYFGVLWGCR